MSRSGRLLGAALFILAIVAIGLADVRTGSDIGFSLFYLVPIALAGWYLGIAAALTVAVAAAVTWLLADLAIVREHVPVGVSVWNAFTRMVIYCSQGALLAVLRRDRDRMQTMLVREVALARTDAVTNLPNGRAFVEALESALQTASSQPSAVCLVYVDLDNFKAINDRLGHAAGDAILEEVGRVLMDVAGKTGFAARIGGDEFGILLPGIEGEAAQEAGDEIVNRIRRLGALYSDIGFGATAGIVCLRDGFNTADELLRAADDAMYRGKVGGKGRAVTVRNSGNP